MRRIVPIALGAFLGIALTVPIIAYAAGGSHLIDTSLSPDGRERIEFYTPARWQVWTERHRDMPAWVRLVQVGDSMPLGDSGIFDLSGEGRVAWTDTVVQVGSSASYDRATRRWTIIQE